MVRLKHRYILFEVLYPPKVKTGSARELESISDFSEDPKSCLLRLHASSPPSVNPRSLVALIKRVLDDHYGEQASGTIGQLIIVKYFSNKTSSGIIRCNRTDCDLVVAALGLITRVESREVVMRCVHVSGTIRKCETFSIRSTKQLMIDLGKDSEKDNTLNDFIAMFAPSNEDEDEFGE